MAENFGTLYPGTILLLDFGLGIWVFHSRRWLDLKLFGESSPQLLPIYQPFTIVFPLNNEIT